MEWNAKEKSVEATVEVAKKPLTYEATNLRVERNHRHATITISYGGTLLDEDDISLHKREERQRLANSAHKALLAANKHVEYAQARAQADFLLFTRAVWGKWMDENSYVLTYGVEPTSSPWILRPFALQDSGTILFSGPGKGKSFLALSIAIAIDEGTSTIWKPERQANVLFVNLERTQKSLEARLWAMNKALGFEQHRPLRMIHKRGGHLVDVSANVRRIVEKHDIELVILDSLSRVGKDLINNFEVNLAMDELNGLGCAWLALGHTPRSDADHVYGSQMFSAAADLEIGVECEEIPATISSPDTLYQRITVVKANDVAKGIPRAARYQFTEAGVSTIDSIPLTEYPQDDHREDIKNSVLGSLRPETYQIINACRNGVRHLDFVERGGCREHSVADRIIAKDWATAADAVLDACKELEPEHSKAEWNSQVSALALCECCLGPIRKSQSLCSKCDEGRSDEVITIDNEERVEQEALL